MCPWEVRCNGRCLSQRDDKDATAGVWRKEKLGMLETIDNIKVPPPLSPCQLQRITSFRVCMLCKCPCAFVRTRQAESKRQQLEHETVVRDIRTEHDEARRVSEVQIRQLMAQLKAPGGGGGSGAGRGGPGGGLTEAVHGVATGFSDWWSSR